MTNTTTIAAVLLAASAAHATPSAYAGTNAEQRARDRTVTLTVGGDVAGTTHYGPIPLEASVSGVATVGFFLDPDLLVEGRVRFGQYLDAEPHVDWYVGGSARLRKFVGDAMYVAAGPEVRTYAVAERNGVDDVVGTVVTIGADLGLGHQWQWERFTFGVEWIGMTSPLFPVVKSVEGEMDDWDWVRHTWMEMHYVSPYVGGTW